MEEFPPTIAPVASQSIADMFESLAIAIEYRSLEAASGVVAEAPDVVIVSDQRGQTALHLAVDSFKQGRPESDADLLSIVELLLNSGSDIDAVNKDGHTPLQLLVGVDDPGIAQRLLSLEAGLREQRQS